MCLNSWAFFFFFCLILHFVSFWENIYVLKVKMLKQLASKKKTSLQFFLHTRVWHFKLSNKLSRLHTIYQNIFSPKKWPIQCNAVMLPQKSPLVYVPSLRKESTFQWGQILIPQMILSFLFNFFCQLAFCKIQKRKQQYKFLQKKKLQHLHGYTIYKNLFNHK